MSLNKDYWDTKAAYDAACLRHAQNEDRRPATIRKLKRDMRTTAARVRNVKDRIAASEQRIAAEQRVARGA